MIADHDGDRRSQDYQNMIVNDRDSDKKIIGPISDPCIHNCLFFKISFLEFPSVGLGHNNDVI